MRHHILVCFAVLLATTLPSIAGFSFRAAFPRSGSAACVDYDKDGYADLIIGLAIYHNNGNGAFSHSVHVPATVDPKGNGTSAGPTAWVDFDGDGIRDVLVAGNGVYSRLDSNGNAVGHPLDRIIKVGGFADGEPLLEGHFDIHGWDVPHTDQTAIELLTTNQNATFGMAIADVNGDGKPDVYLGRGRLGDLDGIHPEWYGKDWLVKNASARGSIEMTDISNDVGLTREHQFCPHMMAPSQFRDTEGIGAADYNYDGYPDFFGATYRCKCNSFWKGGTGDKHRYSVQNADDQHNYQPSTGVDLTNIEQGDVLHGCGVYWFDYDNDGYLDLLEARTSHYQAAGALRLWHNSKDGAFTNASILLPQAVDQYASQHYRCIAVGDYDNDGDLDFYVTRYAFGRGTPRELLDARYRGRLLKNTLTETGLPGFVDATATENLNNGSHADIFGACFIDCDNDGKLDLFTEQGPASSDAMDELWKNDSSSGNHWLLVNLLPPKEVSGVRINTDAIGAVVQVWIDKNRDGVMDPGEILTRQQMGCTTGASLWQGPVLLHFGLGQYSRDNAMVKGRVFWPGTIGADGKPTWVDFGVPGVDRIITVSESVPPSGIPGIPTPEGSHVGTSVEFQWEPADDIGNGVAGYDCQIGTSPDTSDVFDGNVGASRSKTVTGQDGTTYYCRVRCLDDSGKASPWSPSSDGATVDIAAPAGSVNINNGADYTADTSAVLSIDAHDSGSGMDCMRISQDGVTWADWEPFANGPRLEMSDGDGTKTVWIMLRDVLGNTSEAISDSITLDTTAPTRPRPICSETASEVPFVVSYHGAYDAGSGLRQVQLWYKKGQSGTWRPASCAPLETPDGSFPFSDVTEQDDYYFDLMPEDMLGNRPDAPSGEGGGCTRFTGFSPCTVGAAKAFRDDTAVIVSGVVTTDLGDFFYIEAEDRSAGVRIVSPSHDVRPTDAVLVTGHVRPSSTGEREIQAVSVTKLGLSVSIRPLGMTNRSMGGGTIGLHTGISGASGLNNIGLLARVTGRVTADDGTAFRIDDGSGVGVDAVTFSGLGHPSIGRRVVITGIASCAKDGDTVRRLILVTSWTAFQ